jgi:CelD/BcsL family acetyltransferase involved in cellulose biosynthesis
MTGDARIEIVPELESLRDVWAARAQESRNIFSSWEWASTWWNLYGAQRRPLIVVCRGADAETAALLPLYLWTERPFRVARFIGHGPADQLGPVCGPAANPTAAEALRRVAVQARLDLALAELLPGRHGWPHLLGVKPLLIEASPTLSLEGGWDAYLSGRSANFRQQVRRRERKLHREHVVHLRLADEPRRLRDDLTLLFALHRARWGAGSPFLRFERFHRDFAAVAFERGWLRLWFLELDGRPVAAWYGFRFAGVESYYQAGRHPALVDESLGFLLLAHSIRQAAADGVREYRLLRGAESFKLRFADADPGVETLALARGIAGRVARVAVAGSLRSGALRSLLRPLDRRSTG